MAEAFLPNPDNLPIVNHKDGNKLNNQIDNLEWVSYSENAQHAHANGLIAARKEAEFYTEDLEDEVWKAIPNFSNYSISNKARVRNDKTQRLLSPSIVSGYQKIRLSERGQVSDFILHILVYLTFNEGTEIPQGYKIDHIDGNKLNNTLENLRCISNAENAIAAYYETWTNSAIRPVGQYDLTGKFIAAFPSVRWAARELGLDSSTISKVCRGQNKTHGGFIFHYISLEEFKNFNDYPEIANVE